jgi:hypothetical protein
MATSTEYVGINVKIPRRLHRRLRLYALANEMTLAEVVTKALREWLPTQR